MRTVRTRPRTRCTSDCNCNSWGCTGWGTRRHPKMVGAYGPRAASLDMAVAAGETECTRWQFEERLSRRAVDVILPDICRAGGISEGRRIATVASPHNTRWAAHVSVGRSAHVA